MRTVLGAVVVTGVILDFHRNLIGGVFDDIHIDDGCGIFEKLQAVRTKMPQMQFFACLQVTFRDFVKGFNSRQIITRDSL